MSITDRLTMSTKTPKTPKKFYVFIVWNYDVGSLDAIVEATEDGECVRKVIENYDKFDDLFMRNLTMSATQGGLLHYLSKKVRSIRNSDIVNLVDQVDHVDFLDLLEYSQDTEEYFWKNEVYKQLEKDYEFRKQLVIRFQDDMLKWISAYDKDSEGHGMSVEVRDSLVYL